MLAKLSGLLLALMLLASAPSTAAARADELSLEETFTRTAGVTGHVYQAGRDLLVAQRSERAIALFRERATSEDQRQALLAKALLLRIDNPMRVEVLQAALRNWHPEITRRHPDVDQAVVRFQRKDKRGSPIETREVVFSDFTAPLVADLLYEAGGNVPGISVRNAAFVAGHMHNATLIDPVLHAIGHWTDYEMREQTGGALALFGPVAAPAFRELIEREDPADGRALHLLRQKQRHAARALAVIGDAAAVPVLAARLPVTRDRDLAPEYARALAALDAEAAAPVLLGELVRIADELRGDPRRPFRRGDGVGYEVLRDVLLSTGGAALREVERDTPRTFSARLICDALRWELGTPDEAATFYASVAKASASSRGAFGFGGPWGDEEPAPDEIGRELFWRGWYRDTSTQLPSEPPRPLLREAAWVAGRESFVIALARHSDAIDRDLVARTLTGPWAGRPPRDVLIALAETAGPETLSVCDELVRNEHTRDFGGVVEALLLHGDATGTDALDHMIGRETKSRTPEAYAVAEAIPLARLVRDVLRGESTPHDLLKHETPSVRLVAARALARRGDAAGHDVLVAAIFDDKQRSYSALRDDLLRTGAVPDGLADGDERHQVLAAALTARLADREGAQRIDAALSRAYPHTGSILGPQLGDFVAAGRQVADEVGAPARTLFEEHALFGPSGRVALFALAALSDERSIPVVLRVARGGNSDAAEALRLLGPKGIAAAATVPPPNPELPEYGGRAGRHLVATEALGDEESGLPKLLEGFREAQPGMDDRKAFDQWRERQVRYLKIAATREDPELLEPTLALLETHGRDRQLRREAIRALQRQRDDRIAPACVPWLSVESHEDADIRRVLFAQLGLAAPAYVLDVAKTVEAPEPHRWLLHHAAKMAAGATNVSAKDRSRIAEALRPLLSHESKKIRGGAAYDLISLHLKRPAEERDDADRLAVITYVATERGPYHMVTGSLTEHRVEGARDAILTSYRAAPSRGLLSALAQLEIAEATPDVIAELELRLAERAALDKPPQFRIFELQILAQLSDAGRARVLEVLQSDAPRDVRIGALGACGQAAMPEAFDAALALFTELRALDERNEVEKRGFQGLPYTLAKLDPRRAHVELTRLLVDATDRNLVESLAGARAWVRQTHPEVVDAQPELDGE